MKSIATGIVREQAYIDGHWRDAADGATFAVTNPATGERLASVADAGERETRDAIAAAARAFQDWSALRAEQRAEYLHRWCRLMEAHRDGLARLMTAEQGKPLHESFGEIDYAASFIRWFAEEARRVYGDVIPSPFDETRILALRQPVGVVGAITPWNFPSAMITRKAGPALAAGCTFVCKPAEATPLSALALAALAEEAGIPPGVFNVVPGDARAIGGELTRNPTVRKLSFTGSTEVGKLLMEQCADTVKKLSLELGGNAPFIVFDDADLDAAVEGAIASKYRNTGQTCVCTNRFLVQSGIHDDFAERLTERVGELVTGNGLVGRTDLGPLIDEAGLEKVESHIEDAVAHGAEIRIGGRRHSLGGTFFEPTVLTGATPDIRLAKEETFGPVAALFRFESEAEAVEMANDTRFGLAAYFYTQDLARSWRVAEALEYGIVGLNTGLISTTVAPFGGVKESGFGREGSKFGIDDYVEIKYVAMAGLGGA